MSETIQPISPHGNNAKKMFSLWKVLLPVAIGITVVVLMFWHDAKKEDLKEVIAGIDFTARTWVCFVAAFLLCLDAISDFLGDFVR